MKSIGELTAQVAPPASRVQQVWRDVASNAAESGGMDKAAFVELLNGLWAGMGRKEPDATTKQVWYFCLHDLTVIEFANAIRRYLTERSTEYVNVQLLRELSGVQQTKEAAAVEAWDTALQAVRLVGSYASPEFDDPYIAAVIQHLGGWVEFCGRDPEELRRFVRGQFVKTYHVLSSQPPRPVRLINLTDKSNAQSGMIEFQEEVKRKIEQRQLKRIG